MILSAGCKCRCLDLSSSRRKLALVDETNTVVVYDLNTMVSTASGLVRGRVGQIVLGRSMIVYVCRPTFS